MRHRAPGSVIAAVCLAASLVAAGGPAVELSPPARTFVPPPDAQPVDLVICLDTSGSMKQLLDAVRARLWDVVNELAAMGPTPDLRVGLVVYGTRETADREGWIALRTGLTRDLDRVFAELFELRTSGDQEYVGRAIHTALERMSWSEDPDALRILFVAGNESADQGRAEFDFREQAREAQDRGIFINALYAGNPQKAVEHGWDLLAAAGGGEFSTVGRRPEVSQISTPQDAELEELNGRLTATYVPFGEHGQEGLRRMAASDSNSSELGRQSLASRIVTKAGPLYNQAAWDLIDAMEQPGFDPSALARDELPAELRGLSEEDLLSYLEEKRREREQVRQRIRELALERQLHLQASRAGQAQGGPEIGDAMRRAIDKQAATRGFTRDE